MERKHIAEEIHFDLKELFEICADVIDKSKEWEDVRGVLKVAKALIMRTETISLKKTVYMSWQVNIYIMLTKKTASTNYMRLMMLNIKRVLQLSFFVCNAKRRQIGRGSSDSRRIKSDQRILGKTIAPILGASQ